MNNYIQLINNSQQTGIGVSNIVSCIIGSETYPGRGSYINIDMDKY